MPRKLQAPDLCDEASVGGNLYHVDNDGTVVASEADAGGLLRAGFSPVEAAPIAPEGFAVVKHEDPTASCSWAGESFAPNARGEITVPVAAVAALAAHGFAPVEAPAA